MEEKKRGGPKKGQVYKKRKPYTLQICEWCGETGKGNVFLRWHGNRCKHNPDNQPKIDIKEHLNVPS